MRSIVGSSKYRNEHLLSLPAELCARDLGTLHNSSIVNPSII